MASLVLAGDTSGSITVSAPAVAGSTTQTLVNVTGTLAPVVSGTAITLTNQTAPEFTGIPSWVKRITVMFSGVSTNGTSLVLVRVGDGAIVSSGYSAVLQRFTGTGVDAVSVTDGFRCEATGSAASARNGSIVLTQISGNTWVCNGNIQATGSGGLGGLFTGNITLSGILDRVRITTVNGTDQFDAGTINILYE
jgi:hypothetical protein